MADNEQVKRESRFLRGTLEESFSDPSPVR